MSRQLSDDEIVEAVQRSRSLGAANCWTGSAGALASLALEMARELTERRMTTKEHNGESVRFSTGAIRSSDAESTRYDLVSPIGLEAVAKACAEGAARYGDFNWEAGMPVHDLLNHALRHVYRYLSGDRSEDHLGHAAWGLMAAIHSEQVWPELNAGTMRGPGCLAPGPAGQDAGCQ